MTTLTIRQQHLLDDYHQSVANHDTDTADQALTELLGTVDKLLDIIIKERTHGLLDIEADDARHEVIAELVKSMPGIRTGNFGSWTSRVANASISRLIDSRGSDQGIPESWFRAARLARTMRTELHSRNGYAPTVDELRVALIEQNAARELGRPPVSDEDYAVGMKEARRRGLAGAIERLDEVLDATAQHARLDNPIGDGESTLADLVASPTDDVADQVVRDDCNARVAAAAATVRETLSDTDKAVLDNLMSGDRPNARLAEELGISREGARQAELRVTARFFHPIVLRQLHAVAG